MTPLRSITAGLLLVAALTFATFLGVPAFIMGIWDGGASFWLVVAFVIFLLACAFALGIRGYLRRQ